MIPLSPTEKTYRRIAGYGWHMWRRCGLSMFEKDLFWMFHSTNGDALGWAFRRLFEEHAHGA